MNFAELTISEANQALVKGEISSVEITSKALATIKESDGDIHAFLNVFEEEALQMARDADKRIKQGEKSSLVGIPLAIKDNILVKGFAATAGSKILESYQAAYDATVTKKLRDEGAIFLGKTNLDEFAMGSSTENSGFGPTKNPHDHQRVPGGSSGGSAAAVAANMCLGALGSDTGGSIRQPASFCGIVGLKPTYGAVSRFGLIALASSLDQIGPVTKTVEDSAIIYNVIKGSDILDSTSFINEEVALKKDIKKLTIGVPREYFELESLDGAVKDRVEEAILWYEKQGAKIENISLPSSSLGLASYYLVMPAEASANLARYDGIRYGSSFKTDNLKDLYFKNRGSGFGAEAIRRIMIGTYALSSGYYDAYYKVAKRIQTQIKKDFKDAFGKTDVIMTPTTPTVAFKLGEKVENPLQMYAADIFTVPVNMAGLPAISLPCGRVENLPVGLQIIAPWYQEKLLFKTGLLFEKNH